MTTAPTATNKTAAKSTQTVKADTKPEAVETKPEIAETAETTKTEPTGMDRIPESLRDNSILRDFFARYLGVVDEIADYNKVVLAEKNSEWTAAKVLEKSVELASPTDANVKANDKVKKARETFERLSSELSKARKEVINVTAEALGITLSNVADRDAAVEAPLKEKRKLAAEIGSQLSMIASMTNDKTAASAVEKFLNDVPLPAIGRDQARSFGNESGTSTPKYRVTVKVTDMDDNVKLEADGFTKTALGLTKFYPRGEALKADKLREVWEAAGNSGDKTVKNVVEFTDNDLKFTITKK